MHSNQLCQAAGLKLRRYEKSVRPCVDLVGPCLIVHDIGAYVSFVRVLIVAERILVNTVACAQHHDLGMLIHHLRNDTIYKIESLLICQTGDQADHELVVILNQSQLLLKLLLIYLLLGQHIGEVIVGKQPGVRACVPYIIIDAVYNTAQLPGMISEMGIQLLTVVTRLDLSRVRVAHRGDHIRVCQSALQHIGVTVAYLQRVLIEHIIRQTGPVADGRNVIDSLEPQIVNRQNRLCACEL